MRVTLAARFDRTVLVVLQPFAPGPWRRRDENDSLSFVPIRTCIVSFSDTDGLRHSVDVQAETLYEAAALAIRIFREHECAPGPASQLDVEARNPGVTHKVSMMKIQNWLQSSAKSPSDRLLKERLKTMLASQTPRR